ncbi:MAG: CoA-binding protein [Dehalococcoidia bacterium]|nr:CoA-binding protein [Dehalococcoidia bacterium]MDD5495299.1 CoA-binding protein [Dehalococcoidia bacterium]
MNKPYLDFLFHPQSMAIVGVSPDTTRPNLALRFLQSLSKSGFKGKIYPIHPAGGEINGLKVYPSLRDVPGNVDYVISAIPAKATPKLLEDSAAKGVKAVHLFTSGYSEIEDVVGKGLETQVLKIARANGIRIIGPNCMGVYCPESGLTFSAGFPGQPMFPSIPGPLGLISQSGGNSMFCIREATGRGLYFSKLVSYGNAADLNESDYLEYLTEDPDTRLIGMYVEGVKDGRRFLNTLKKATDMKPVIIYKAGVTESGARTCASHTSSIAGSAGTWQAFLRQFNAIQVYSMEEIVDVSLAMLKLPVPQGRRTVVIGTGGGAGVIAADDCTQAGLTLPLLPADVRKKLRAIYGSEAGSMFRNPVDAPPMATNESYFEAVKILADSDAIDIVIMQFSLDIWGMAYRGDIILPFIDVTLKAAKYVTKPMAVVLHNCATPEARQLAAEVQENFVKAGLAVYPSLGRAAGALHKYLLYNEERKKRGL